MIKPPRWKLDFTRQINRGRLSDETVESHIDTCLAVASVVSVRPYVTAFVAR
jgi:hypothetical protein